MGVGIAADISSEAIYLKNWALNYILNVHEDGKVAGCITKDGDDPRLNHMKPFLAQGAYLAGVFLNDFSWLKPHVDTIKKIIGYREKHLWNKKYDLAVWHTSMESGADNNVAVYRTESLRGLEKKLGTRHDEIRKKNGGFINEKIEDYPVASVASVDVNTLMYREYRALSLIAKKLKKNKDSALYKEKGEWLKKNMQKLLWNTDDGTFYNLDTTTGEHIKVICYSNYWALFGKVATKNQADTMIKKYLWNSKHMLSKYGLRTLSKQDDHYNNVLMLKPHSNWQGPVWPIANYIMCQGLLNYGYQKEALEVAVLISKLVLKDIDNTGGMHECYNAETGEPLAAPNFVSWNVLVYNMIRDAENNYNPFAI